MKKNLFTVIAGSLCALVLTLSSCGSLKPTPLNVPLSIPTDITAPTYVDLDKPINVVITSSASQNIATEHLGAFGLLAGDISTSGGPRVAVNFTPSIVNFADEATIDYMRQMRFDIASSADIRMNIDIKTFEVTSNKTTLDCNVRLAYSVVNEAGETIIPTRTSVANVNRSISGLKAANIGDAMSSAYIEALRKINWDRIADCLRVAKTAKQEKNAQVTGAGDTALEHTVIRWNILSSPQGADVSWRVVSSTPDVANTNSNFVGTTPYESTESFDIKGLTYNNSGNVQIEVSCEKSGYLTQRKRFNLRQAIDQKEISAKFNLVKDE